MDSVQEKLDNYRWKIANKELVPIIIGGMGVDISSDSLALEAARLGGVGHISDAMVPTVTDRHFKTNFSKDKFEKYKDNRFLADKSTIKFDLKTIEQATKIYVEQTMNRKKGAGMVFINCMEKLTMNNPKETLKARLNSAMDAGIDGITLSAGLHLYSFDLVSENPRFRDCLLGIIVSSSRALKVFLQRAKKHNRMPDYIIVEGPLAGGHLGFGQDWRNYNLKQLYLEIRQFLIEESLEIPVIVAGGVFTGSDAIDFMRKGASAVQVATRFTVTKECGLPDNVKQVYFKALEQDTEVAMISPTGYPMRILKNSPGLTQYIRPNCETYGFLLDKDGFCAYLDEYYHRKLESEEKGIELTPGEKVCLCTHMRNYKIWTCGHYVYRLKDTSRQQADGKYQLLTAEHVFKDYQFSTEHQIALPETEAEEERVANLTTG